MDDLIERLRYHSQDHGNGMLLHAELFGQAAARIAALEADNARLRETDSEWVQLAIRDNARIVGLEADNARLMGLVKEAYEEGFADAALYAEIAPSVKADWELSTVRTTLAKIKGTTDGR